jgi:hypothetical protein
MIKTIINIKCKYTFNDLERGSVISA